MLSENHPCMKCKYGSTWVHFSTLSGKYYNEGNICIHPDIPKDKGCYCYGTQFFNTDNIPEWCPKHIK